MTMGSGSGGGGIGGIGGGIGSGLGGGTGTGGGGGSGVMGALPPDIDQAIREQGISVSDLQLPSTMASAVADSIGIGSGSSGGLGGNGRRGQKRW